MNLGIWSIQEFLYQRLLPEVVVHMMIYLVYMIYHQQLPRKNRKKLLLHFQI